MDINIARKIIEEEKLTNYNLFDEKNASANEVVICKKDNLWEVYVTSEKGGKGGGKSFESESDALINFIERLRADKIVREYMKNSEV